VHLRLCWLIIGLVMLGSFGGFTARGGAQGSAPQARPTVASESKEMSRLKGYGVEETGLLPQYPKGFSCPPLTSLYASWIDVDGSRRDEIHTGVDGGRLGDWILAPGPGIIKRAWNANWGWGPEGALLVAHTKQDLGLGDGPELYYSEFDHLKLSEVMSFQEGQRVARGQRLAHVSRPGGDGEYLPEVHWEVWEVRDDSATKWSTNSHGAEHWTNSTAHLIDPLYMLGLDRILEDGSVPITPFSRRASYRAFRGFTYIFPCTPQE